MKFKSVLLISIVFIGILSLGFILQSKDTNQKEFPDFVYTDPMSLSGYTFAKENGNVLKQFDCYCGCYDHLGHSNLRDCFIFNGKIESHASYCDVCKALNQKVQKGLKDGLSIEQIQNKLRSEYA